MLHYIIIMSYPEFQYRSRTDAGSRLAEHLKSYRESGAAVFAVPRGGVPVAIEVAQDMGLDDSRMTLPVASYGVSAE